MSPAVEYLYARGCDAEGTRCSFEVEETQWHSCSSEAEAVLYASHGVDVDTIAKMVDRTGRTVREWLAGWRRTRLHSVLTGHAGNQNAAKLTRIQKEQLKEVLSLPPSEFGLLLPVAPALRRHEFQAARPLRQAP